HFHENSTNLQVWESASATFCENRQDLERAFHRQIPWITNGIHEFEGRRRIVGRRDTRRRVACQDSAAMSTLDWPYTYRPTSSRSGWEMTSHSCADPTEPAAQWMTLIIATTQVARAALDGAVQDDAAGVGQDAA